MNFPVSNHIPKSLLLLVSAVIAFFTVFISVELIFRLFRFIKTTISVSSLLADQYIQHI